MLPTDLDTAADAFLSEELQSNNLKVTTRGHISTTLNTPADCDPITNYYSTYGQPAEFEDETQLHLRQRNRWER